MRSLKSIIQRLPRLGGRLFERIVLSRWCFEQLAFLDDLLLAVIESLHRFGEGLQVGIQVGEPIAIRVRKNSFPEGGFLCTEPCTLRSIQLALGSLSPEAQPG
jgi:hypothetical protein